MQIFKRTAMAALGLSISLASCAQTEQKWSFETTARKTGLYLC